MLIMRMKLSNLERTFIEAKVHDVTVDGHDDDQALRDLEIEKPPQRAVTSRDAIAMEKCIVFTEHMMCLLQQLNGEKCVGQDVDATLFTKKNICWNLLGCFLELQFWPLWRKMGFSTNM